MQIYPKWDKQRHSILCHLIQWGEALPTGSGSERTDLSDDLIGTLDEDLHGPPVVVSHPVQEPLRVGEGVKVEREGGWVSGADGRGKKTKTGEAEQSGDLAGRLAVVELFGEQLDPLQHGGLEEEAQRRVSFSAQEAAQTSHMTTELPRLTFSLEWMNVSRTNDVLSWKIVIVTNVFTDAKITSQTWKKNINKKTSGESVY